MSASTGPETRSPLLRLLGCLKPYGWRIALGLVCLLIATPAQLFSPLVWRYITDEVVLNRRINMLLPALGVMIAVQLAGVAIETFRTWVLGMVGQEFVYDLRNQIYRKLQGHGLRFFHEHRSGDLLSRAISDVDALQEVAINGVDSVIASALQFVGVAGIIIWISPKVGGLTMVPMLLVGVMVWAFNSRVRGLYRRIRDRLGDVSAKLQENLLGILVIKAFARERYEIGRFEAENGDYLAESRRGVVARSIYFPSIRMVGFFSSVVMIGAGAYYILKGEFTLGSLLAYRSYWWQLFQPVFSIAQTNEMLQRANAASSRLWEILDEPYEIEDADGAEEITGVQGAIDLHGVTFGYTATEPVLTGVDLHIPPGGKVGVVGPSGAGKSTLMALLLRLYDPLEGRILLDGRDLRAVTQESLRRPFGVVTQEPFLFNETIRYNILYGRPEASAGELEQAVRQANAHDFIAALPDGYETLAGERGVKLSGGQKQRICIARAFLANPRILLLDEATAAVEPESEAIIQDALERLMEGRTAVVISHRLSMVRACDPILVVNEGGIAERGCHEELMALDGWYARMYRLQMGVPVGTAGQGAERRGVG